MYNGLGMSAIMKGQAGYDPGKHNINGVDILLEDLRQYCMWDMG